MFEYCQHVRTGLALKNQTGDEELQIDDRHALAESVQRRFNLRTERQLLHYLLEFHFHWIGCFRCDGLQTAMDVVAGLHRSVEEIDGIGQHIFKLAPSPPPPFPDLSTPDASQHNSDEHP